MDERCCLETIRGIAAMAAGLVILVLIAFTFVFAYAIVSHW